MDNSFWFWVLIFVVIPIVRGLVERSKKRRTRPKIRPLTRRRLADVQIGNDPLAPAVPEIISEPFEAPLAFPGEAAGAPPQTPWEIIDEELETESRQFSTGADTPVQEFQQPPPHILAQFEAEMARREGIRQRREESGYLSGASIIAAALAKTVDPSRKKATVIRPRRRELRRLMLWSELLAAPLALRRPQDLGSLAGLRPAHLE